MDRCRRHAPNDVGVQGVEQKNTEAAGTVQPKTTRRCVLQEKEPPVDHVQEDGQAARGNREAGICVFFQKQLSNAEPRQGVVQAGSLLPLAQSKKECKGSQGFVQRSSKTIYPVFRATCKKPRVRRASFEKFHSRPRIRESRQEERRVGRPSWRVVAIVASS